MEFSVVLNQDRTLKRTFIINSRASTSTGDSSRDDLLKNTDSAVIIGGDISWTEFLLLAAKTFQIPASTKLHIFNIEGGEIEDFQFILPNETLVLAKQNERFLQKLQTSTKKRPKSDWVTLNIGGVTTVSTRSTLTKDSNEFNLHFTKITLADSMLAKMFGSEWDSKLDDRGAYLIDRTPEYFVPLINYLRCGELVIEDQVNLRGVLHEAEYFQVESIIEPLKELVAAKERQREDLTREDFCSILLTASPNVTLRCQGLSLVGIDLSRLDLSTINFKMSNLCNANLERSNLSNSMLQEANLKGANLQSTILSGANLARADLECANLRGANFEHREGVAAHLEGANLRSAILEDSNLSGANLRAANLRNCNLRNANLFRADLAGADLEGANLIGANLKNANITGTNLARANFDFKTVSSRQ
eukprot:TRINITY_DN6184_c0_g1_i1.p1 TRINITY_DN6184_c0_g1~~TRINITY_DN6184_c0_g1_i1.p1  ORF type:complete len:420 (+),score=74.96 TRINITY_DN6184_c0_g1_i1:79-1338(+)